MKKTIIIIMTLALSALVLAGCSNNSQLQIIEQGVVRGTVQMEISSTTNVTPNILNNKTPENDQVVSINTFPMQTVVYNNQDYIVKFTNNFSSNYIKQQILKKQGKVISRIAGDNTYKIRFKNKNQEVIKKLKNSPLVSYIEPDYLVHIQTIPNDSEYYKQWNLKMLGLEKTWENYKGGSQVVVAIVDTGILPNHPDLKDKIVPGYDFIDNDNDPTDTSPTFSHGTHVAGIIGAMTNNNQGVAGINWNVKIMPVRVIGPEGNGGYSTLISGIRWAVDHGADVINLSLAGPVDSNSLKETIDYAVANGVTVVAAAGNNGSSPILYPARYKNVISVGAIGPDKKRSYYSNYGPNLDLVAPGGDNSVVSSTYNTILSTAGYMDGSQPVYKYSWAQGTSMATPHVSGLIALLYSAGITDPASIQKRLKATADDLGPVGKDDEYGAGLININRALNLDNTNYNPDPGSDSSSNSNQTGDNVPGLTDVMVFAAKDTLHGLERKSGVITPDSSGNFNLKIDPGTWTIVGWVDSNDNGNVDNGDYYGQVPDLSVEAKGIISDIVLDLKKVIQ